jgi:hypothetical protein
MEGCECNVSECRSPADCGRTDEQTGMYSEPEIPFEEVTVDGPSKEPDCAPMASHSEVIGVRAGVCN